MFSNFFFFFKQKTAYEMRISDWSSDVCSSDLKTTLERVLPYWHDAIAPQLKVGQTVLVTAHGNSLRALYKYLNKIADEAILEGSEEHTSELQSLMRISYAVFCLKKKKKTNYYKQYKQYTNHNNLTKYTKVHTN